jgi:hypothetical protein
VLGLFADHRHQFPLHLELVCRVFGFDDVLFMRDEGIGGAVADAGLCGDAGRGARVLGPPLDVFWIIQATRIEGRRDHGHQELDGAQRVGGCGHGVGLEGSPGDLDHARLVLHNPIADLVSDLKATPLHILSLLVAICATEAPFSRRLCDAPIQGLTGLPLAQGKPLASMAIGP